MKWSCWTFAGKEFRAVFVSVVRTRRTCVSDKDDARESSNFGFLSSLKLLNTAFTRAQSLIAVVGDPVAVCSVGACKWVHSKISFALSCKNVYWTWFLYFRQAWATYLSLCNREGGLHGISWRDLTSQLDGIRLQKVYGLNALAPTFQPSIPPQMFTQNA